MQPDLFKGEAAPKRVVLIDGYGFLYRAFHALPPLSTPDGRPCNAALGFCRMVTAQMRAHPGRVGVEFKDDDGGPMTHDGTQMAVVFEKNGRRNRQRILPTYKTNRPEPPQDLRVQFDMVREATIAFGLNAIEVDGWEADDVLATYARKAVEARTKVTIVASDKDMLQLMHDDWVEVYDPMKRKALTRGDVLEKFGVKPEQVADVQALLGDATDNVPGVDGVGKKRAAALVDRYGSLEGVIAAVEEIEPKSLRNAIRGNVATARLSMELVRLRTDVPVPLGLDQIRRRVNETRLRRWLLSMGFESVMRTLNLRHLTT